jgi:hypothetical protein
MNKNQKNLTRRPGENIEVLVHLDNTIFYVKE